MFSLQTIFGKGTRFYQLLERAATGAEDATKALHALVSNDTGEPTLEDFKLARQREREVAEEISNELVQTFVTPLEREDIEALGSALYKIPKQVEKFADRYVHAKQHLHGIDFSPRAAMLAEAAGVVVEMVAGLRKMNLDHMKLLSDKLRAIESEADRLILELYRDLYSGKYDGLQVLLIKDFFEILEKAIDRCREAGVVTYQIVLKNS
ncbi:MAG: DUF47 family protein [Lysobacteraceae bacterium]